MNIQRVFGQNVSDFNVKGPEKENFMTIPSRNFQNSGMYKQFNTVSKIEGIRSQMIDLLIYGCCHSGRERRRTAVFAGYFQNFTPLDNHTIRTTDNPGFKSFTVK